MKKNKQRLNLDRETIRNLDEVKLQAVRGGVWPTDPRTDSASCCATST